MNVSTKKTFYKVVALACIFLMNDLHVIAEKRTPLWDAQNEFSKEGYGLKGPVYIVTTKRLTPIIELGQIVRTTVELGDSLVFDENGKIAKKFNFSNGKKEYVYTIYPDSVEYTDPNNWGNPMQKSIGYRHDSSGRITEIRYYNNYILDSRRTFEYTPTGFSSVYYHDRSKEDIYVKKGNEFIEEKGSYPISGKLDNNDRVISETRSVPFVAKLTKHYVYDKNGNIIREGEKINLGNKGTGNVVSNESGIRYEYTYDNYGNWTEKRKYEDGVLKKIYEKRDIIYKTPEEIIAEKKGSSDISSDTTVVECIKS